MLAWITLSLLRPAAADIVIEDMIMSETGECYLVEEPIISAEVWDISDDVEIPEDAIEEVDGLIRISPFVIEDDIIFRVSEVSILEDNVMLAVSATLSLSTGDDCGFCDGLCVDGECLMEPCTNPWGK